MVISYREADPDHKKITHHNLPGCAQQSPPDQITEPLQFIKMDLDSMELITLAIMLSVLGIKKKSVKAGYPLGW